MKFNSAAQNLLLSHLDSDSSGRTGYAAHLFFDIMSGPIPTKASLEAAWSKWQANYVGIRVANIISLRTELGGTQLVGKYLTYVPKYGALSKRQKRGFNLTSYPELVATSSGSISYVLVSATPDSYVAHTFYVLTAGLVGSGADIEFESLEVVVGQTFKLSTLTLLHSQSTSGA